MPNCQILNVPDGSRALAYPVSSFEVVEGRLADGMSALATTVLLDGRLMQYPDGHLEARYAIAGELLSERLMRPFTADEACALFSSIARLIDALIEHQMPIMNVQMSLGEVAVDGAGSARFVFLPLSDLVPDLKAVQGFFRSLGEQMRGVDTTANGIIGSYLTYFQAYRTFDVMAFSKHLEQLVVSAMCSLEPNETIPKEAAAPERFPRGGERTTCLDVERGDDQETTVLQIEEASDSLTTMLPVANTGGSEPASATVTDTGTVVLETDDEQVDDRYADEHVIQSRQGLTGVLSDLDFSIWDDASETKRQTPQPVPEEHHPEPAPAMPIPKRSAAPAPTVAEPEPYAEPEPNAASEPAAPEFEPHAAPEQNAEPEPAAPEPEPSVPEQLEIEELPEPEPVPPALKVEKEVGPSQGLDSASATLECEEDFASPTPAPAPAAPIPSSVAPVARAPRRHFTMTRLRTGETFEIRGRHFVVGKSKHSSFQVRNTTTVSRSHAIFCVRDGVCTVMDDSSRNGTFVNGERLEPGVAMELEDGDTVRMSDVDFVFEVD